MNLHEKVDMIVYVNMFVHYPETYNAYTIRNKFNSYFKEYFSNNKLMDSIYNKDCFVMINSAPHTEEELMKIEVCLAKRIDELINMETFVLNCKEFIVDYFNSKIKNIDIEFVIDKCHIDY